MQTRVKLLGSTALAAAALVMAAPSAYAGKHTALEKRVKALEKAGGQSVTRSKKTMKLVVSGHINRAISIVDNGTTSGFMHVTSNFSRTRVRWIGTGKINDDLSIKTHIELGNSSAVGNKQHLGSGKDENGAAALDSRHIEFQITSKSLGKIYMGQGISGSESISEGSLDGTGIISLSGNSGLIGGGEIWQNNNAAADLGGKPRTVGNTINNLDGLGRRDRIRYDTPKFAGFQVTMSHGNSESRDVALRYGSSFGGVKVKAAVGWWDQGETGGENSGVSGHLSVLLPFGLTLTVAAGDQDNDTVGSYQDDTAWRYGKIGYKFSGLEMGQTRLFVDYSQTENAAFANDEGSYWGLGVVQILEPLGAELYAVYNQFSYEIPNVADPDDIDRFAVGARFKF